VSSDLKVEPLIWAYNPVWHYTKPFDCPVQNLAQIASLWHGIAVKLSLILKLDYLAGAFVKILRSE
jgi:hypothetical protein